MVDFAVLAFCPSRGLGVYCGRSAGRWDLYFFKPRVAMREDLSQARRGNRVSRLRIVVDTDRRERAEVYRRKQVAVTRVFALLASVFAWWNGQANWISVRV